LRAAQAALQRAERPLLVIGSQAVAVIHGPTGRSVWVLTDGVRPFKVQWPAPTAQAGRS
jgi:hypothetical protein